MRKIISMINPFVMKQTVTVYEDGNKIDVCESSIEELDNTIFNLSNKYNIKDITLIGSKQYNKGISKRIKEQELSKYNKNELNITIH